ncbi:hypothetical protein P2318_00425 [Myxococcaceae bacterium GXIMD 01537]
MTEPLTSAISNDLLRRDEDPLQVLKARLLVNPDLARQVHDALGRHLGPIELEQERILTLGLRHVLAKGLLGFELTKPRSRLASVTSGLPMPAPDH